MGSLHFIFLEFFIHGEESIITMAALSRDRLSATLKKLKTKEMTGKELLQFRKLRKHAQTHTDMYKILSIFFVFIFLISKSNGKELKC